MRYRWPAATALTCRGLTACAPEREASVLRPGGRLQIADVVVHTEVSEDARKRIDLWTG